MPAWLLWLIALGPVLLAGLFLFTPLFGELAARVPRWLGRPPRIWDDSARVLAADFDEDGLLQGLVYEGEERIFQPMQRVAKRWIRRWERGRGIVWEQPAALARPGVAAAAADRVVFPTLAGTLRAIDPRTGEARFEIALGLERLEPTRAVGARLLFGGTRVGSTGGGVLLLDARDGTVEREGPGHLDAAERALRERLAAEGEALARDGDDAVRRRFELRRMVSERPRSGAAAGGKRFDYELIVRREGGAPALQYPLGAAGIESELRVVRPLGPGPSYALSVSQVLRAKGGPEPVTLVVDPERGRVLADLAPSGSLVLTPSQGLQPVPL